MNVIDELIHTTVRIECQKLDGKGSCGTGFFFIFCETDKKCVPAIVTNKHVIRDATFCTFRMTERGADGQPMYGHHIDVPVADFQKAWINHPDPNVDLAVLPLAMILDWVRSKGKQAFYKAFNRKILADTALMSELNAIEDVIMVGYPNGLWDRKNNLPLVRKGITASPLYVNFDGRPEFMIDCACFPGSSGSPIMLYNIGSYTDKQSGGIMLGGSRVKLLGVLFGGPQYTAEGLIEVVPVPTAVQVVAKSAIPNNLGYCIKADQLLAFEEYFDKRTKAETARNNMVPGDQLVPAE